MTAISPDGFWPDGGGAWTLGAAYSYALAPNLDLEAGFTFVSVPLPRNDQRIYLPWLGPRLHGSLSEDAELGLSLRCGGYFLTFYDAPEGVGTSEARTHVWTGWHIAASPDLRVWLSPRVGLEIAPEVAFGGAKDRDPVNSYYLRDAADLLFLGGSVRVVLAP